ncbi:MAG: nucleoside diphosphate kinase regulator [Rhizobiaceae bacterium]|nr:nucleoside diphosphate kinase regulator [Rhizobiaceae bacterium]
MKTANRKKPKILVSDADLPRLTRLADAIADQLPDLADELLEELERARVVKAAQLPDTVVRMGSTVSYSSDDGQTKTITLVFPAEADIAAGRVSILTPIGTALLGLSPGQSMEWTARDGRRHKLTVDGVGNAAGSDTAA